MDQFPQVNVVPEPGTLALLVAGLIILIAIRKTRAWGIVLASVGGMFVIAMVTIWWFRTATFVPEPIRRPTEYAVKHVQVDLPKRQPALSHGIPANIQPFTPEPKVEVESSAAVAAQPRWSIGDNMGPAAAAPATRLSWSRGLVLLALLSLGGLAVVVTLIVFRKTRVLGIVLACMGGLFVIVAIAFLWLRAVPAVLEMAPSPTEYVRADRPKRQPAVSPAIPVNVPPPAIESRAEAESSSVNHMPELGMVEAMAQALSKTMADARKNPPAKAPGAKPRPAWLGTPSGPAGDSYQMAIVVGPWPTRQECDAKLPEELQKALDRYTELCLGKSSAARIVLPYDYLRRHIVKDQWEEVRQHSISPTTQFSMTWLHVFLQFDPQMKERVIEEHRHGIITARLSKVGIGLAAGLWFLAVYYGYLRIDLATGGVHRSRLRFAAAAAILVAVAVVLTAVA